MTEKEIGATIMECRKIQKITREELGERAGMSQHQIARIEKGHIHPNLLAVADALGLEITIKSKSDAPDTKKNICKLYKNGVPLRQISKTTNLSQATILKYLREWNIPLRNGKMITEKQEADVVSLYNEGLSLTDIMKKTAVKSEQTIYRILRDHKDEVKRRRNRN